MVVMNGILILKQTVSCRDQFSDNTYIVCQLPQLSPFCFPYLSHSISDATNRIQSRAEQYLKACRKIGVTPISSFLRNSSEANLNLNHYGVGPLGAKALAIALQVGTLNPII